MSDHSRAFVPIETWVFNAPELASRGISVDVGQLAESLIYYDQVLFNVSNQPQFARVLQWFNDQGKLDTLLSLVTSGDVQFYEYSFVTAPLYDPTIDKYHLVSIQDEEQAKPDSFEKRFLYHRDIEAVIPKGRARQRLYQAFRGRVIEAKADAFGDYINEARRDFSDPERTALIVQAFVDEIYAIHGRGRPPRVESTVKANPDGGHTVTVNVDFDVLARLAGEKLDWEKGKSLAGGATSCKFLQSAATLGCDLYLAQPMARLVGDKLYESVRAVKKPGEIIQTLQQTVEFPNVRSLVNDGRLSIDDVLHIRSRSIRFRRWLQSEADRNRDALIAYHNEVAKESGLVSFGRKALNLFGFVGGAAVGAALGEGPLGAATGAAIGGGASWLADLGSKVGAPWRPIAFGNWLRDRIAELDRGRG